jgi:hypothetical protein
VRSPEEALEKGEMEEKEEMEENQGTALPSPIYDAPDEFSALRLQAILEEAGVRAWVRSAAIPWIAGVTGSMKGYWGRVLVHPDDRDQATELVRDYLASLDDDGS